MREEFPELEGQVYLEHAHRGPLPVRARRAIGDALALAGRGVLAKPALLDAAERARTNVAALLGARPGCVHFTQNTTAALAEVAAAIDLREGDRVVTSEGEWPSAIDVWRRPGVKVDVVPLRDERLDLEIVERAAKGARVLSFAVVSLATGERRDTERLAAIAKRAGALLVLDAAQALGVLRLDVGALGADALAACSRKWLLGPPETGVLYVREGAPFAPPPRGALAEPLLAGLAASSAWLLEVGIERIEREALARAAELAARARAKGFAVRGDGPIVRVLGARATDESVVVRALPGEVRLSPHFWNPFPGMARAVETLMATRTGG